MRRACLAGLLLMLTGCVTTEPAYLATGLPVTRVACTISVDALGLCYKAAGDLCGPRGFAIYDWDGRPWSLPYPDPQSYDYDGRLDATALLVACRS
ncbi:MAG: hypothetical protein WDN25_12920 [Acetobacteraceae bacterium]